MSKRLLSVAPSSRRSFLKMAAFSAGALTSAKLAGAEPPRYGGPFWLFVHASGGWDTTLHFDPRGNVEGKPLTNDYDESSVLRVNGYKIAPLDGLSDFVANNAESLFVVGGIDVGEIHLSAAHRYLITGSKEPGVPSLAALIAATAETKPLMPYVWIGPGDEPGMLQAPTRIPQGTTLGSLQGVAEFRDSPVGRDASEISAQMLAIRGARAQRLVTEASSPRMKSSQLAWGDLAGNPAPRFSAEIDAPYAAGAGFVAQIQTALSCFSSGLSVCAHVTVPGFDTNTNNDARQRALLRELFVVLASFPERSAEAGVAGQVNVLVYSECSRAPVYNAARGKDRWPGAHLFAFGPAFPADVVGRTDENLRVRPIRFTDGDVLLTPALLHKNLRRTAGISEHPIVQQFPLRGTDRVLW